MRDDELRALERRAEASLDPVDADRLERARAVLGAPSPSPLRRSLGCELATLLRRRAEAGGARFRVRVDLPEHFTRVLLGRREDDVRRALEYVLVLWERDRENARRVLRDVPRASFDGWTRSLIEDRVREILPVRFSRPGGPRRIVETAAGGLYPSPIFLLDSAARAVVFDLKPVPLGPCFVGTLASSPRIVALERYRLATAASFRVRLVLAGASLLRYQVPQSLLFLAGRGPLFPSEAVLDPRDPLPPEPEPSVRGLVEGDPWVPAES